MFYKPGHFVFIHLPRTAGCSIERSLHDASGGDFIYSTCSPQADLHRHATAAVVRSICWDWESIYRWCVVRNVWEVIDSVIRRGRRLQARVSGRKTGDPMIDDAWTVTPAEAARDWFGGQCNFFHEYCDGHDIDPVRYEHINTGWQTICRRCNVPLVELEWHNVGHMHRVKWTEQDIEYVANCASQDIATFNWEPPPILWSVT